MENIELFKFGFLTFTLIDAFDVLIVTFVFYKMYSFIQGTIAERMFIGLIIIVIVSVVAQTLGMIGLSWLFDNLRTVWVIAFVILFQPEIRRMLLYLGENPLVRVFMRGAKYQFVDEIIGAVEELSQRRYGALIVILREAGIKTIIESGVSLQAKVSRQLIISIFNPRSPLHDGAIVMQGDIIEAAQCLLPLSQNPTLETRLGTRHRAALGITEQSDAVTVVVSEETGTISVAEDGVLTRGLDPEKLKKFLLYALKFKKKKEYS